VINAIVAGEPVAAFKPHGRTVPAIDTDRLRSLFAPAARRHDRS
jgi:hypothetical protein